MTVKLNKIISTISIVMFFMLPNISYAETTNYTNVRVTNFYTDQYKGHPMICVSFRSSTQSHSACSIDSEGASRAGAFPYYVRVLLQSYLTGDNIWIKTDNNAFTDPVVTWISRDDITSVGSCNNWCFGSDKQQP
ncbi:subtilase family AB5 toxin binding subunit [Enterovibrio nigricans]|uniref:Subtilase cytotoxin subunit B n=1 Tax=Enterovibrio nigricans DSM 22720 TaxID=1121868 RepID=A0A1T4WC72_9GAMM|nr:subtilase family AB5 toxin binding subunit [Enterovibrio nigricans]SKA74883.1 subtilase cytotoxin subunit B [Enterovibrio nigricans DSM 22720]